MKTLVVLMAIIGIACGQPIPTPMSAIAPKWSEPEAIAVVKASCQIMGDCYDRHGELLTDVRWSAKYQPAEKRWAVTLTGKMLLGGNPLDPIVSYVYENTKTVEWNVTNVPFR